MFEYILNICLASVKGEFAIVKGEFAIVKGEFASGSSMLLYAKDVSGYF